MKKKSSSAKRSSKTSARSSSKKPSTTQRHRSVVKRDKVTEETSAPRRSPLREKHRSELTTEERRRLLKPKDHFEEVLTKTATALRARREIRVPGMTVARLEALNAKAVRAAKREALVRTQFERKIRPLSDARLLAEDAAYRALLDVYAAIKLYARSNPKIGEEFAFLTEHVTFSRERPERASSTPEAPSPEAQPDDQPGSSRRASSAEDRDES
jgi:hypothetical protein